MAEIRKDFKIPFHVISGLLLWQLLNYLKIYKSNKENII
jgi:hypothetical protein